MIIKVANILIVLISTSFSNPIITEVLIKSNVGKKFSLDMELLNNLPDSIKNRWHQEEFNTTKKLKLANEDLSLFGIKIILEDKKDVETFRVIRNSEILDSNLLILEKWETSKNSFLIKFENKLIYNKLIFTWDNFLHGYAEPCLLGDSLLHVEKIGEFKQNCNPKTGGRVCCSGINYALLNGTDSIYYFNDSAACADPLLELLVYKNKWYLQNRFTLIVNGANYNSANGFEIIYNLRLIDNKLLFFYEKNGRQNILFDGEYITNGYDRVVHNLCCEGGLFNILNFADKISFFANNNGNLYLVELKF